MLPRKYLPVLLSILLIGAANGNLPRESPLKRIEKRVYLPMRNLCLEYSGLKNQGEYYSLCSRMCYSEADFHDMRNCTSERFPMSEEQAGKEIEMNCTTEYVCFEAYREPRPRALFWKTSDKCMGFYDLDEDGDYDMMCEKSGCSGPDDYLENRRCVLSGDGIENHEIEELFNLCCEPYCTEIDLDVD